MQSVFTFAIDTFALSAFAFFAVAFVAGFIERHREINLVHAYREPVATVPDVDMVIASEPIDWKLWKVNDLRSASQRKAFDVPLRVSGKVASKGQLIALYTEAMA